MQFYSKFIILKATNQQIYTCTRSGVQVAADRKIVIYIETEWRIFAPVDYAIIDAENSLS